ncbi:hypothetical protein AT959_08160 [Dechloromonas denitrificans]|uniref:MaoC-like domain-containing protein n=1 Tax=Dechloromonas denitrificans TaxID=281362 RepID=A0A133XIF0_9RHOO|nr:MaoC/PaaZ C-terminal domain-containing protein [Dechloromonas denitrificans]KXB30701.1 hypothetical protein AT959_08160 [Dechloromonas denitrificans]
MTPPRPAALPTLPALLVGSLAGLWRRPAAPPLQDGLSRHFAVAGIDPKHAASYCRLFDFRHSRLPLSYFYLLAQRAQLALMLDRRFPHAIPGLIHTGNDLRLHAVPRMDFGLTIAVSLGPQASTGKAPTLTFGFEMSQLGRCVLSGSSEYRLPKSRRLTPSLHIEPEKMPASLPALAWSFEPSQIRRYALLSGDYNPIHLSSLLARRLGFRGAIAHGMYSVARATACIEAETARPLLAISATFQYPIHLPARAIFGCEVVDATHGSYSVFLPKEQRIAVKGLWQAALA